MFALGTFAGANGPFVGLVTGTKAFPLAWLETVAQGEAGCTRLTGSGSIEGLLDQWEHNLRRLETLARFAREHVENPGAIEIGSLRHLPPISRPGKILHAAANYREHVAEMTAYNVDAGNVEPAARFKGDKQLAEPYLFLKASSAITGPHDDIALPVGVHQVDWEAELAVVIGKRGRNVTAAAALDYVAGFMVANDLSCRDLLWRKDRQNFKTDWLLSKSHDGFEPIGPLFVPRQFVPAPNDARISLKVNGVVKQHGSTADMIYSAEEQIEFASRFMTLDPGDIFVTGTIGGVGQATGEFLVAGDVIETSIEGIGALTNRIVAPIT